MDFLEKTFNAVRHWDSINITEIAGKHAYELNWVFEGYEHITLEKAYLIEGEDGAFYFSPFVRKKVNEPIYESFGELIPVDKETSERLHNRLKDVEDANEIYD